MPSGQEESRQVHRVDLPRSPHPTGGRRSQAPQSRNTVLGSFPGQKRGGLITHRGQPLPPHLLASACPASSASPDEEPPRRGHAPWLRVEHSACQGAWVPTWSNHSPRGRMDLCSARAEPAVAKLISLLFSGPSCLLYPLSDISQSGGSL